MYAVIETGGKQYRVEVGTELEVELLDAEPGQSLTLGRVLLVADGDEASIGRPLVANASVEAEVLRQVRGEKVFAFKYRPKARRRVKKGHRQELTVLRITDVVLDGRSAADAVRKAEQDARTERERLEEAARRQAAEDAALAAKLAAQAAGAAKTAKADEAEPVKGKAGKAKAEPAATAEAPETPKRARAKASATPEPAEAGEAAEAAEPEVTKAAADAAAEADAPDSETTAEAPKRSRTKKSE
jgi:large subunit ribosomal protein L21